MRMFCAQTFILWCASIDEQIHSVTISGFSSIFITLVFLIQVFSCLEEGGWNLVRLH